MSGSTGDPSTRRSNFEPHLHLDGKEFMSWEDPSLAAFGSWVGVSHFHPGDHKGCRCFTVPAVCGAPPQALAAAASVNETSGITCPMVATPEPEKLATSLEQEFDGLTLDMYRSAGGHVILSRIVVEQRGQGIGSKVMQRIIDWADEGQDIISLTPDPAYGGTKSRLIEFYKRFGFVENKGRMKDYAISETMYREPLT